MILIEHNAGDGTIQSLAALCNQSGTPIQVAAAHIGEGEKINHMTIDKLSGLPPILNLHLSISDVSMADGATLALDSISII